MEIKCRNCGSSLNPEDRFCAQCGTVNQYSIMKREPIQKIRSESCIEKIEKKEKELANFKNMILIFFSGMAILLTAYPYIVAILNDENLDYVDPTPLPILFVAGGIIIFAVVINYILSKRHKPHFDRYKNYCATETLVVDSEKIYGTTMKGKIQLYYNQIKLTKITLLSYDYDEEDTYNDVLVIEDIVGNRFEFFSFKNCKDLKVIIDMEMQRVKENDSV